ncbi:MAG: caspase family protein [Phormidesmis sp.]
MGLSRRALIKQAGAAIAAMGFTELALNMEGMPAQAKAYTQALAQSLGASSGRKLALLVGINKYASGALSAEQSDRLLGCVTDVAMQKELLIHRFGFLPQDIVCLTNEQATRSGIYQAFIDHLYTQAQPDDVVVLHFSGYGAQVRVTGANLGNSGQPTLVRSLVPYDGLLPTESRPHLNDILESELKTLLKQLKTKKVTAVLDAGFADVPAPLSGGLRSRTRSAIATGQPPMTFPLLANKKLIEADAPFPGVVLRSAELNDVVIERQWNGFSAGAFTYVLTQYVWTVPAPVVVGQALARSQEKLLRWGGGNQQPTAGGSLDLRSLAKTPPLYNTPLAEGTRGIGVVQSVNANSQTVDLWLGGLTPRVLEYLGPSSVITCQGRRLKLRSRNGLMAKARLAEANSSLAQNDTALAGLPILESIRVLPRNIGLIVALDSQLERIERVDATSALAGLSFISSTSDTGLPADCLLAKPIAEGLGTLTASLAIADKQTIGKTQSPSFGSKMLAADAIEAQGSSGYGLFSLTRSLIPGTLSLQEEAIKPAISRLVPKLQSLLALKMLRLSENRASSQLPVRVSLEMISPEEKPLIGRQTFEIGPQASTRYKKSLSPEGFIPQVPVGSQIRYRLYNDSDQPLYYTLINVDPRERLAAFCPVLGLSVQPSQPNFSENNEEANSVIAAASIVPGGSIAVPSVDLSWSVEAPTGPVETYVIWSTSPLTNTFYTLLAAAANSGNQRVNPLPNPLEVVEALFTDISQRKGDDTYSLDVTKWATLNFTYEVV